MDFTQLLETSVVTCGMGTVLFYLNSKTQTDNDLAVLGYMSCSFLLILLHQVAPLFHASPVEKTEGIYRSSTSSGLWCSFMVPSICVLARCMTKTDDNLDIDLLCVLLTLTLTLVHYNPTNYSQIAGALLLLWLKDSFKTQDVYNLGLCTVYSILYYTSLSMLPKQFPKSFTYGESTIVLQSTCFIVNKIILFMTQVEPEEGRPLSYLEFNMIKISMLAILGVLLATGLLYGLSRWNCRWKFFIAYGVSVIACLVCGLPRRSLQYALFIFVNYLQEDIIRFYLLIWYCVLTAFTVIYMVLLTHSTSVSTSTRKLFHVIIVAVYLPGLWLNAMFLLVASLIAFCVIFAIETVRYMKVVCIGEVIQEKYELFIDKQDEGLLALTPVYLSLGMLMPLWFSFIFNFSVSHISVYAGVLSVGVGDTMASLVGSKVGRLKWPGRQKTVEGSLASLVSQIITLYCLQQFFSIDSAWLVYITVAVTTILEATTTQIDNLILPMFLYILLIINI